MSPAGRRGAEETTGVLRDADRERMLAMLFHELRGPISTARGWLHLLRRLPQGGKQAWRAVDTIDRQLSHLARLVEDLLDLSRIREGKMRLERTRLDLAQLARRVFDEQATFLAGRGLELRAEIPVRPLWMEGDAQRLEQAIRNLLENAAKFTQGEGRVTLALEAEAAAPIARLRLRDTGPGFDPALGESLFDAFEQAESTVSRSERGLGLGLAVVKAVVELHGGTVEAHSDGLGTGAEFVVRLPLISSCADDRDPFQGDG